METKNTIEYQIEREHFENIVQGMLKRDIVLTLRLHPHLQKNTERDNNILLDYLGINAPELDTQEIATKYNIGYERVRQIIHKFAKRYLNNHRHLYLAGKDHPILFDWERNVRREI